MSNGCPDDIFNQICAALGLFDGARPVSMSVVLWKEVLPAIEALKANNPEAAVLVEENIRVNRLWRNALMKLSDANRWMAEKPDEICTCSTPDFWGRAGQPLTWRCLLCGRFPSPDETVHVRYVR